MTYLLFLFNRFVYGLPLTLWLLTGCGVGANTIGNAALAVSIVGRGWDVANMPLANLRAPLLSRLHAEGDSGRFFRHQRLMTAVLVITSGPLAVGVLTLGPLVFGLLYGAQYATGVSWGVIAGVVALVANFFTLGNSTLHQTNRFLPELIGLAASAIFIAGNGLVAPRLLSEADRPLAIVLGYVIGRAIFWLITDLWVDARIFKWDGAAIKLRGLLAVGVALGGALLVGNGKPTGQVVAAFAGLALFWSVFRLLGGVGRDTRGHITGLLSARLNSIARFL
jgi:O-antigen/teichoic acid export membrane protein